MAIAIALTVALALAAPAAALYPSRGPVASIRASDFKSVVLQSEQAVVIEFFAPWCGYCKKLVPEYTKAASNLDGIVKFVAIDCDQDSNKQLCGSMNIKGFPTIKTFASGPKGIPEDYNGERTAKAIVNYIVQKISSKYIRQIGVFNNKISSIESFIKEGASKTPRLLFVSDKAATSPLFKALSIDYKDRLIFGEAKGSNAKLAEALTTKPPGLFVWPVDASVDDKPIEYKGEFKQKPIREFLEKHALPPKAGKASKADSGKSKASKSATSSESAKATAEPTPELPFDPTITEIKTNDDLAKECLDRPGACVISFIETDPDAKENSGALDATLSILTSVKETIHKTRNGASPFTFVWLNPRVRGHQLLRDFDVGDSYPNLIVVNARKRVYLKLRSAFYAPSIRTFLDDILGGRERAARFDFKPVLDRVATGDASGAGQKSSTERTEL